MSIASSLPARYEIRTLDSGHVEWAAALASHTSVFYNKAFTALYTHDLTERTYKYYRAIMPLIRHVIDSSHSIGIFDREFSFRSVDSGGKLWWDETAIDATKEDLLHQMDFPLVSCALSYDSFYPPRDSDLADLMALRPMVPILYEQLTVRDKRSAEWKATSPGQVLFRNGTLTRSDYEGKGLMKAVSYALMQAMAAKGFRGIQIESLSDAVTHVWMNPPTPFESLMVSDFVLYDVEVEDENGATQWPFRPSRQRAAKIFCQLR